MKALYKLAEAFERKVENSIGGKGVFPFGNVIVKFDYSTRYTEIEVWNPVKDTYLDRIADYLKTLPAPCDQPFDVFNDHGFRDEEDYLRYRY